MQTQNNTSDSTTTNECRNKSIFQSVFTAKTNRYVNEHNISTALHSLCRAVVTFYNSCSVI